MTKAETERNSHYTKRINEIRAERDRLSSMLVTHKFADKERMQVNGWIAELNKKIAELQTRIKEPVVDRLRGGG